MKSCFAAAILSLLVLLPSARAEGPDDDYVSIYALIEQGDKLSDKGDVKTARAKYAEAQSALKRLRTENPDWNVKAVKYRLNYLAAKLAQTAAQATGGSSAASAGLVQTGEPVEMKIKWEVGKRYLQRLEMTQDSEMNLPGSPQSM